MPFNREEELRFDHSARTSRSTYYDYFPVMSPAELNARANRMGWLRATLLGLRNIETSLREIPSSRESIRQFFRLASEQQRLHLRDCLLSVGIDSRVASAIGLVPREEFAPPEFRAFANINAFLPYSTTSCLSTPGLVALMMSSIGDFSGGLVLEEGIGSGYHAACVSQLLAGSGLVVGFDVDRDRIEKCRSDIDRLGIAGVLPLHSDDEEALSQFEGRANIAYSTFSRVEGGAGLLRWLTRGGVAQAVRPLNAKEFLETGVDDWVRQEHESHSAYLSGAWSRSACIDTGRAVGATELNSYNILYRVTFTPYLTALDKARDASDPFIECRRLLQL